MFDSIESIKLYLTSEGEELDMHEVWEIVRLQQDLDVFMAAYHL